MTDAYYVEWKFDEDDEWCSSKFQSLEHACSFEAKLHHLGLRARVYVLKIEKVFL